MLVLNATYEPINVCTLRRAAVLLLKEKAELLERRDGAALHSEHMTMERPDVIRLVNYVRIPREAHRRKITRRAVLARDSWTCQYCGSTKSGLTVDHVIPRSRGGKSVWENIVAACATCNRRKGNRLPREIHMHPKKNPKAPPADGLHPGRQPEDPRGLAAVLTPGGLARRIRLPAARAGTWPFLLKHPTLWLSAHGCTFSPCLAVAATRGFEGFRSFGRSHYECADEIVSVNGPVLARRLHHAVDS